MTAGSSVFDARELALLIWLTPFAIWIILSKRLRLSVVGIAQSLREPKVIIPIVLTFAYGIGVVWVFARVGLWTGELFSETLFWLVGPGIALLFGIATRERDEQFLKRTIRRAFTITVLLEFVLNLRPLPLVAEVLLLPVLVVLMGSLVVAEAKPDLHRARPMIGCLLLLIGIGLLSFTARSIISDPDEFRTFDNLREFLLPVLLTLSFVPYLYLVDVYASYDTAFTWTTFNVDDRKRSRRAKLALTSKLLGRTRDVRAFNMPWGQRVAKANSLRDARREVDEFRAWAHEQRLKPVREQECLERYAGVAGTDEDGRQLDRREFKETKEALRSLLTAHMGWYRRDDRYRDDLLAIVLPAFDRFGLPEHHGITMHVAGDGQSWWAWRRVITGWCFGAGAMGPPPDEWIYDGPEPPSGPPEKNSGGWSRFGGEAMNW